MRPTKITLQNFLSYGDVNLDLSELKLVALLGHNGSGKSSLVESLTFAMFGEGRYKEIDRYIRQGQENATVELQFELNGETYRVVRTRSNKGRGKSTLELARLNCAEWIPMSGATLRETQDKIRNLLRMDYETFVSSCIILQDEADRLTKATPGKRMEIFSQILGLDVYDRLQEAAKKKVKKYHEKAAVKRAAVDNLDAELSGRAELLLQQDDLKEEKQKLEQRIYGLELELETQKKCVSDLRVRAGRGEELKNRKSRIAREITDIDNQLQKLEQKQNRLQQIIIRGDEIRANAAKLEAVKGQLVRCEDKAARERALSRDCEILERMVAQFDRKQESEISRIEATLQNKKRQAELLDQVPCAGTEKESCKLLTSAREAAAEIPVLEAHFKELRSQKNPHIDAWQKAVNARNAVGYNPRAHQVLREKALALEKWARMLPELEQAESTMAEASQQAEELQQRKKELLEELDRVTARLAEIEHIVAELRKAEAILSDTIEQLKKNQEQLLDVSVRLGTLQARLKDLEKKAEQKKQLEAEVKDLAKEEYLYTCLVRACKEIPVLIMENVLPDVEDLANELLGRLTEGRISVRFETQKEAKTTGMISDTLDIIVSDDLGERPYEGWSGAERFEVNLAIRLAISKFLARRAGAKIEVLILDEGASCLDAASREKFVESINIIAEDFKLVIVVSHIDELKEAFPQQIHVYKTPEGSHVEVLA